MVVAGIGLLLGLVMLFCGMALLEQERKDKKKRKQEQEERIQAGDTIESLAEAIVDSEQAPTYVNLRRTKLGAFLVAQGALMAIVAIALFVVNAYVVELKWYISLPIVLMIVILSVLTDAFMMGAPVPPEDGGDMADDDDRWASEAEEVGEQTEQETSECTQKEQTDLDSEDVDG